jgi:hypothetical protein
VAAEVLPIVLVLVVCVQLLPYLQEKRVGVISAAPLCMGLWRPQASSVQNVECTAPCCHARPSAAVRSST